MFKDLQLPEAAQMQLSVAESSVATLCRVFRIFKGIKDPKAFGPFKF